MYTQTITSGCPGGGIGRGRGEKIYFIKNIFLDFPGSAEVKTLCSQCEGHGLYFWKRNKDATCHAAWQKKLKKKSIFSKIKILCLFVFVYVLCIFQIKMSLEGIPWWSSGLDSELSLPRAQVQSLVGELRY